MKTKFTRRDFLKMALAGIGAFLVSCMPRSQNSPTPTVKPVSKSTDTPEPSATSSQTPTTSETATATEIPCPRLLTPEDGAVLPTVGRVTFSWEAMPGAAGYKLEIVLPTGQLVELDSTGTSYDLYIEVLSMGGVFHWRVTALYASGEIICATEEFIFDKAEFSPLEPSPTSGETISGGPSEGGGPGQN